MDIICSYCESEVANVACTDCYNHFACVDCEISPNHICDVDMEYAELPSENENLDCHTCGKPATKACGHCYEALYCGTKCQALDWEDHRLHECYAIDEMSDNHVLDEIRMHVGYNYIDDPEYARIALPGARNKGMSGSSARRKIRRENKRRGRQARRQRRKDGKGERVARRKEKWEKFKGGAKGAYAKGKGLFKKDKTGVSESTETKKKSKLGRTAKGGLAGGAAAGILTGGNPAAIVLGAGGGALLAKSKKK